MATHRMKAESPRRPALAKGRATEAAKIAIDAQAARIAALKAEVDRLKIRAGEAEGQREDWRRAAATADEAVAALTMLNDGLTRENSALAAEIRNGIAAHHEARRRLEGENGRLDEMVRQCDATIAGMAIEMGRLSRAQAARHVADAGAAYAANRLRATLEPSEAAERAIAAARQKASQPAPTSDPVGFGRQPDEQGA